MDVPSIQHARYRLHAVLGAFGVFVCCCFHPDLAVQRCSINPTQPSLHSGKGASGIVVLAKDVENARPVAIKLLERGPQVNDYTEREAFTHRLLNHPHVVKMKVCR